MNTVQNSKAQKGVWGKQSLLPTDKALTKGCPPAAPMISSRGEEENPKSVDSLFRELVQMGDRQSSGQHVCVKAGGIQGLGIKAVLSRGPAPPAGCWSWGVAVCHVTLSCSLLSWCEPPKQPRAPCKPFVRLGGPIPS